MGTWRGSGRGLVCRGSRRAGAVVRRALRRVCVSVMFAGITARYPVRSLQHIPAGCACDSLLVIGQPGHQRAQAGADLLDLLGALGLTALEEVRLARVELLHQLPRERSVLDLAEDA